MVKIIFLRHAESESNRDNIISDNPQRIVRLTDTGVRQAEAAAEKLRAFPFTRAFTSEFERTRQTAAIVLKHHDCEVVADARINERKTGMDGHQPEEFHALIEHDWVHARTLAGESFIQKMERLKSFMAAVALRFPDELILSVSPEDPIRCAVALVEGDPLKAIHLPIKNAHWIEVSWQFIS